MQLNCKLNKYHREVPMKTILFFIVGIFLVSCGHSTEISEGEVIQVQQAPEEGIQYTKYDEIYFVDYNQDYQLNRFLEEGVSSDEEMLQFFDSLGYTNHEELMKAINMPFSVFCSVYTAENENKESLFARNLESGKGGVPVMLYTHPKDGYSSISMVNGKYFSFSNDYDLQDVNDMIPMPYLPFDGMNEYGLSIASNSVPAGLNIDDNKVIISSYGMMRTILDRAKNVDEAIDIIENYNIYFVANATIKFIIADSTKAIQVEFMMDKVIITPEEDGFLTATNFLASAFENAAEANLVNACKRNSTLYRKLIKTQGVISDADSNNEALRLLKDVGQPFLNWSVIYNQNSGEITIATKTINQYNKTKTFMFDLAGDGNLSTK